MDNRLVFPFLFVMLVGSFMGTYAQTTAATANTTATTANTTATTANTTATTANTTATTANTTATTANTTETTANTTATTANTTATTANTTATTANNNATTTTAPATTAPPITPNSTVTNLTTTISASNCSKTQLCARQPSSCDPSTGTGCFFLGVKLKSGQNFEFALSGESDGYIAAILSRTTTLGNNDTSYICANNKGAVQYLSALLNNGTLNNTTLPVNNVKGKITGRKIECTFDVTVPDSSQRAASSFSLSVANGTFNADNGTLGSPRAQVTSNVVDLTNATAINNAIKFQQSLMQALLITVGLLSLTVL